MTYTASSFTSNTLNTAGTLTMTVTVTDSRGRTATTTKSISVLDYSPPSLTKFKAERCNANGSAAQMDGTKVRVSLAGSVSSVGSKNTVSCAVYYKLSTATAWTQAATVSASNYAVSATNLLLSPTFDALKSYDLKVRPSDYFYYVEQSVSVGTKQVLMDFYKDGNGVAFGKVAEGSGKVEFGWPVVLSQPLGVDKGGTGATTASAACAKLGAVKKSGDTMTGNLSISGYLYPSLYLLPTCNSTTNRTVFEGSYVGASSFSSWTAAATTAACWRCATPPMKRAGTTRWCCGMWWTAPIPPSASFMRAWPRPSPSPTAAQAQAARRTPGQTSARTTRPI